MDKETRNRIQKATQAARSLLEQDFLDAAQRVVPGKLVAAIRRRSSVIRSALAPRGTAGGGAAHRHGGPGPWVMDSAMVEAAAYCLVKR